jgi:uncharacterized protein (TIGR02118 family)
MIVMYVAYPGDAQTRFDRDYYVSRHIPIVMAAWQQYGLLSCDAFFPASADAATIAIAECKFRDEAAIIAALGSPEASGVMADVPRFTDSIPVQHFPESG